MAPRRAFRLRLGASKTIVSGARQACTVQRPVRFQLRKRCFSHTNWARNPSRDIPAPRQGRSVRFLAGAVVGIFFSVLPGATRLAARSGEALPPHAMDGVQIDAVDRQCTRDTECTLFQTHCGGCSCGTPINRAAEATYQRRHRKLCEGFRGAHCEINCPQPTLRCVAQQCTTE